MHFPETMSNLAFGSLHLHVSPLEVEPGGQSLQTMAPAPDGYEPVAHEHCARPVSPFVVEPVGQA